MDLLAELAESLTDKPLMESNLLVNRKEDLENLGKLSLMYRGTLIGVTGERGIGKTTVFNLFNPQKGKKILLRIMNRDSIETIFADLCYGLSKTLGKTYLDLLETNQMVFSANISPTPGLNVGASRQKVPFQKIVEDLRSQLDKEADLVIILDEIDKESKEEIIRVMDALKYAFEGSNTTVFVAIPPSVHKEYIESKSMPNKTHNLENIFSFMIELGPLKDEELEKMVVLRTKNLSKMIEQSALDTAVAFARGNPRQMLSILKEATLRASEMIKEKDVKSVIKGYLSIFVKSLNLSHKELVVLEAFDASRDRFLSNINKAKIFSQKTSGYVYIKRLVKKGALKISEDNVVLDPRLKLALEYDLL